MTRSSKNTKRASSTTVRTSRNLDSDGLASVRGGADPAHCGQDDPFRALGCEAGYHWTKFVNSL